MRSAALALVFPPSFSGFGARVLLMTMSWCVCGWELGVSRNSARFFWKSLPQEVKDTRPELAAVWRIGQCLWNRDYAGVNTAAQGFEWGPDLADFITAFLGIVLAFIVMDMDDIEFSYGCVQSSEVKLELFAFIEIW
jgi:hypothetical protein